MQSVFFAFLMAVPYETPIETLSDVVLKTDRAHFCGSAEQSLRSIHIRTFHFLLEGTYEVFFSSSSNPLVQQVYELAKQEKYGSKSWILSIKPAILVFLSEGF